MAATNRDFTLKRNNGSDIDLLLPTTHLGQIYSDNTLTTTLSSYLDTTYVATADVGAASGVAPLDVNTKIPANYLPDSVFDSLKYFASVGADTNLTTLASNAYLDSLTSERNVTGYYWVATATVVLTGAQPTAVQVGSYWYNAAVLPSEELVSAEISVTLEKGDWIILDRISGAGTSGDPFDVIFAVVNNTYETATTAKNGIVTLSSITSLTGATGNNVITDAVLEGLIGTTAGTLAEGNHSHSDLQPLDTDLTTIAGLSFADNNFIVGNGTTWTVESGATARTSLGLGALATLGTINNDNWSGTDLSVLNGGTGASNATDARTNLGLVIGTNVQAYHANLGTVSGYDAAQMTVLSGLLTETPTSTYMLVADGTSFVSSPPANVRTAIDVYSTTQVDNLLTNRPEIYYDTTTGTGIGDLIIDLD